MGADVGETTGEEIERVAVCAAEEEDVEVTILDYFLKMYVLVNSY